MDKVFTNLEHAAWLREQARLKRPYWYGCYHNKCTEALLAKKARQYPSHYTATRMPRYRQDIADGQIAGDCVNGAIKGAVWSELGKREPVYASHGCPDTNADGMFSKCKAWGMPWGTIDTMPDEIGIAVRMAGHVGVYVGNGEVVEWRGFGYGCVITKLKNRKWKHWYKLPWTEYVTTGNESGTVQQTVQALRRGMAGEAVRDAQNMLLKWDSTCLPMYGADGEYGAETEKAVREYQGDKGLEVNGIIGPETLTALKSIQETTDKENPYEEPAGNIRVGNEGNGVRWVQWELLRHDANCLPKYGIDGDYGSETLSAVKTFQQAHGLKIDGIVGKLTRAAMKNA